MNETNGRQQVGTSETTDALQTKREATAELNLSGDAQARLAEIQGMMVLAKQFPRDLAICNRDLQSLCRRFNFADRAVYNYPRGGKAIVGRSVWLARQASSVWGNTITGFRVLFNDGDRVVVEGMAHDIQTNARKFEQLEFRLRVQRKVQDQASGQKVTKWVKPDERDAAELIRKNGALVERNATLHLLPIDFVDDAYEIALKTKAAGKNQRDKPSTIKRMLTKFAALGITQEHVAAWMADSRDVDACPVESLTDEEIVALGGVFKELELHPDKVTEYFDYSKAAPKKAVPKKTVKKKSTTAKPGNPDDNKGHDNAPGVMPRASMIAEIKTMATNRMGTVKGGGKLIRTSLNAKEPVVLESLDDDELKNLHDIIRKECGQ